MTRKKIQHQEDHIRFFRLTPKQNFRQYFFPQKINHWRRGKFTEFSSAAVYGSVRGTAKKKTPEREGCFPSTEISVNKMAGMRNDSFSEKNQHDIRDNKAKKSEEKNRARKNEPQLEKHANQLKNENEHNVSIQFFYKYNTIFGHQASCFTTQTADGFSTSNIKPRNTTYLDMWKDI